MTLLHRYRFGGCVVATDTPLPALPDAAGDTTGADIRVRVLPARARPAERDDWLHLWREDDDTISLALARVEHRYRLRFPGLCDFDIDAQHGEVTAEPVTGLAIESLEHLLVDQVLPRVLAQCGALVAHASVVRIGAHTVLFLGRSGWGKSTLAGLLRQQGHLPLSDDCALLDVDAAGVRATPTYPSLRLYDDSIGHAFATHPDTAPVADYTSKRRVRLPDLATADQAHRVDAIYLIQDPRAGSPSVAITPLPLALGCIALIEHSFRLDITDRALSALQLQQCATVLRTIPAFSLQYPRDFSRSGELLARIEAHIASLPATAEPTR
jgi:hypothetical protein